jgi:hypothetical protein
MESNNKDYNIIGIPFPISPPPTKGSGYPTNGLPNDEIEESKGINEDYVNE